MANGEEVGRRGEALSAIRQRRGQGPYQKAGVRTSWILNGLTRPFFGWVSDHIGRENTMFVAFGLEGLGILLLINFAHVPVLFVVFSGLVFFAWGEIYSLFPAMCSDLFGQKFATANYGLLYTAKGTASLRVPLGNVLQATTGSWLPIFIVAIAFDWLGALLAFFVLKPCASGGCPDKLVLPTRWQLGRPQRLAELPSGLLARLGGSRPFG